MPSSRQRRLVLVEDGAWQVGSDGCGWHRKHGHQQGASWFATVALVSIFTVERVINNIALAAALPCISPSLFSYRRPIQTSYSHLKKVKPLFEDPFSKLPSVNQGGHSKTLQEHWAHTPSTAWHVASQPQLSSQEGPLWVSAGETS